MGYSKSRQPIKSSRKSFLPRDPKAYEDMRIAVISRSWFTEIRGGAERYIYEVTRELIRRGQEVTTVSRHRSDLPNRHIATRLPDVPLITSATNSLLSAIFTELGGYEAVIVNGFWAELSPLLLRKPWVVIIHDVGLFRSQWAQEHRLKHFFRKVILGQVVRRASRIIIPSKLTFNDIRRNLRVEEGKIELITEGINLEKFRPYPRKSEGIFRILQSGRFAPNKGQALLVKAFKRVHHQYPNTQLCLVGYLSRNELPYYTHLLNLATEERDIIFKTNVSEEELIEHYNQADLCVFPSIAEEGWGLTVSEAFACRVPVICSPIFFETGVANDRRALHSLTDPNQLADKIIWAIEHRDELEGLVSEGYKFVQGLSWRRTVDRIMEAVESLVKDQKCKPAKTHQGSS